MALSPGSFQFQLFFILTAIIVVFKIILAIFLGIKVYKNKKSKAFTVDFVFAMFILIITLFVSRLFFIYFDFVLTEFDSSSYYLHPNILYWKLGLFISSIGLAFSIFVIDRKVLNFKFKGIISYTVLIGSIIILLYPVDSQADFEFVSFLSIVTNIGTILLPIMFIYIGVKTPGLRGLSFSTASGFIVYSIGTIIINEAILSLLVSAFGSDIRIILYILFMVFKIAGLSLIVFSVSKMNI